MVTIESRHIGGCDYKILAFLNNLEVGRIAYSLFTFDSHTAVILDLEVLPEHQRKGIGYQLLETAIQEIFKRSYMKRVLLQDGSGNGSGNGATSRLAERQGFKLINNQYPPWWELNKIL